MSAPGPFARGLATIRALVFLGLTFSLVVLVGFWLIPLSVRYGRPVWMKSVTRRFVRTMLPVFGIRVRLEGAERLADPRPMLIFSNHQSFLDIPLMMGWVRWPSFLAKKEIASWPLFGPAMRALDCVFVDRSDRRDRAKTGSRVQEKMARGVDFCIFPEGTRSVDGVLLPLKSGSFHIATGSRAVLLPVVIDGTWKALNKKGFRMFPGEIVVHVLESVDCGEPGNQDPRELCERIEGRMRATLGQAPAA